MSHVFNSDQSKYMAKFMVDGWFKAKHLKMKHPWDDVPLEDGHVFMVTDHPYKDHLRHAYQRSQVMSLLHSPSPYPLDFPTLMMYYISLGLATD